MFKQSMLINKYSTNSVLVICSYNYVYGIYIFLIFLVFRLMSIDRKFKTQRTLNAFETALLFICSTN